MLGTHFMLDVPMPDGAARGLKDAVPFREVYIHGLIRDADGSKMSKTKGNVVDPIDMINRFGTDAVRFTLAAQASPGSDIAFNEERTDGYRAFANKIWNAARFLQMQKARGPGLGIFVSKSTNSSWKAVADAPLETRWIVSRLNAVAVEMNRALGEYRFDEAAGAIYQFFWGEFCDWYLELVKLRLDFADGEENVDGLLTLGALYLVFGASLRLLSPFMPFITEEIWHSDGMFAAASGEDAATKSIALTRYPQAGDYPVDAAAEAEMTLLQELIVTVRALRKELQVPERQAVPVTVSSGDAAVRTTVEENVDMLGRMARVSAVEVTAAALAGEGTRSAARFDVQMVYERQIDVAAERERLTKDLAKYGKGLEAANRQLSNEAFHGEGSGAHHRRTEKAGRRRLRCCFDKADGGTGGFAGELRLFRGSFYSRRGHPMRYR